jgi:voltage-gated potassium channel
MIHVLLRIFRRAGRTARRNRASAVFLFLAIFAYATSGFMYFEQAERPDVGWLDAGWWAIVTMATVGYGDYFPQTMGGRWLIGVPTMLLGIGLLGYLLSLFAGMVMEVRMKALKGLLPVDVSDHIIVCRFTGIGPLLKLVEEIRGDAKTRHHPIVLIDTHLEELPPELQAAEVLFVRGDPAREPVLEQAAFRKASYLLVQLDPHDQAGSDDRNLKVVLTVERLHPEIRSIVHCRDPENVLFFQRAGADSVICTEALSSQLMVQEMQDPGVHAVLAELSAHSTGKQCFIVPAPGGVARFEGLKSAFPDAVVLGLRRQQANLLAPGDQAAVLAGDEVILVAKQRPR